jgi:large subunit ribosomal protein L21
MYAIVKTGGKQYRVERGQSLLVERLPDDDGASVQLQPLLYVDGSTVLDGGDGLAQVTVEARIVAHERGPKLRIVKFKPKRGYKRRTGHRQELTRLEVTEISLASNGPSAAAEPEPVAAGPLASVAPAVETPPEATVPDAVVPEASAETTTPEAPAEQGEPEAATESTEEANDGS